MRLNLFEIISLIFMLKKLNPNNIHINNGNHEEKNINRRDGFRNQIISIFNDRGNLVWENFNNIFVLNHSAIMIENPNKKGEYTYLAHGGFPAEEASVRFVLTDMCPSIAPSNFPSEFSSDAFNNESNKIFIPKTKINGNIRWVDFYGGENVICNTSRGGGWVLGTNLIEKASKMGIKLTIRGHQDNGYNTKLIKKGDKINNFININDVAPYNISRSGGIVCYGYTHLIKLQDNGNMNINNIDADIYIPVVTISTNTDLGRNLVRDSFTILKFMEEFNSETQGCVEENSEDEKIIQQNIKKLFTDKTLRTVSSEDIVTTLDLSKMDLTSSDASPELEPKSEPKSESKPKSKLKATSKPFIPRGMTDSLSEEWKTKYLKYKSKYLHLRKFKII